MEWWGWCILGVALLGVELLAVDAQFYLVFAGLAAVLVGLLGLVGVDLPEARREITGRHAAFRVRGRTFVYFLDDHHGDGIVSVCVKSQLGENLDRARLEPERFYLPAHIGPRGWFGMRLDRGRVPWREVEEVVEQSYRLTAPKAQIKKLDGA